MVVMDLSMPRKNGLEAAREIKKASPSIPILLWTISSLSSELLDLARRAGIAGTLSKSSVGNLVTSIETILGGGAYFSRDDNPASTC
jgi:DNA-binding NarL/FixJ family response regulator